MADDVSDELQHLQRRLSDVEHLTRVGFFEWDMQTGRVDWTAQLFRLFGHEPGDFVPSYDAWLEAVYPDDREFTNELVTKAVEARGSYAFDHRVQRPDGELTTLHCRGRVVLDDAGEPARVVGISRDVTDARVDEHLRRRFIADAAHELRTPVMAIQAALDLLERGRQDGENGTSIHEVALDAMRRHVDRLRDLTSSLLDMERLRPDGHLGLVLEDLPLRTCVEEAVRLAAVPNPIDVAIDIPGTIRVRGVREHVERIFVNLLRNASIHGGPNVSVAARESGLGHVEVHVTDDGPGLAPGQAEQLFAPFSRGNTEDTLGAGLGLSIVQRLVEGLGGSIAATPAPGGGARFVFTLEAVA